MGQKWAKSGRDRNSHEPWVKKWAISGPNVGLIRTGNSLKTKCHMHKSATVLVFRQRNASSAMTHLHHSRLRNAPNGLRWNAEKLIKKMASDERGDGHKDANHSLSSFFFDYFHSLFSHSIRKRSSQKCKVNQTTRERTRNSNRG